MAKYVVQERSFINNRLHEVGELVEHEFTDGGKHGPNLKPHDEVVAEAAAVKPRKLKARIVPPGTGPRPPEASVEPHPATGARPNEDSADADDLV